MEIASGFVQLWGDSRSLNAGNSINDMLEVSNVRQLDDSFIEKGLMTMMKYLMWIEVARKPPELLRNVATKARRERVLFHILEVFISNLIEYKLYK